MTHFKYCKKTYKSKMQLSFNIVGGFALVVVRWDGNLEVVTHLGSILRFSHLHHFSKLIFTNDTIFFYIHDTMIHYPYSEVILLTLIIIKVNHIKAIALLLLNN